MKSVFLTFLMFMVVFSLLKLNVLNILSGNYLFYPAIILFIAVIVAAVYFIGIPNFTENSEKKENNHKDSSKKLKSIFAAFLLVGTIVVLSPSPVLAEDSSNPHACKKETMKEVETKLQEETQNAVKGLKASLDTYNTQATNFIKNCVPNLNLGTPWSVNKATEQVFASAGISNASLQYTGIGWSEVNAPQKAGCDALLKQAKETFSDCESKRNMAQNGIELSRKPNTANCSCDENGENPKCVSLSDVDGQLYSTEGKCKPFSAYQQELASCPLCFVFEIILNTDAKIAHVAWNAVAKPLQNIVVIFFLVLIAIESLKGVSAISGMRISSYLKSVLGIGFKIAIAYILLSQSSYIYGYFVSPVLKGGLDMGLAIVQSSGANTACMGSNHAITSSQELDGSLLNSILDAVKCFNDSASVTPAIGRGLMCNSTQSWHFNLSMWLNGAIMYLLGLMIWLAISFYLIDCTVQLGFLCALLPLLIACWPFKLTQNYSYKGVKMLMNTFFNFVMVGVILLIGTMIMTYSSTGNGQIDMNQLITALNNNDLKTLDRLSSLDALQVLITVACAIFAMKLVETVNDLSDQFSKGAGTEIGSRLGGLASSAATRIAVSGAKIGGNSTLRILGAAANRSGFTEATQKGISSVQRAHSAFWRGLGSRTPLRKYQNKQTGSGLNNNNNNNNNSTQNNSRNNAETTNNNPETET